MEGLACLLRYYSVQFEEGKQRLGAGYTFAEVCTRGASVPLLPCPWSFADVPAGPRKDTRLILI